MTTQSTEPVAPAEAQQSSTILRRLRLSVFLVSLPFGMLLFGLPLIARELGASAVAIGGLLAVYALIIVVAQPVVGYGLDHFGRRPFLIVGLLGYAFSSAIFGLASDLGGLFLAQLAQGVGSGLLWLAALAVVSDLAPEDNLGREYGRIEEMSIRGVLIGTAAGFALLHLVSRTALGDAFGGGESLISGWRILFLGFTAATLLAVALAWRGVPESLERGADLPEEAPATSHDQPVESDEKWRLPGQLRILLGIVILTAIATAILDPILIKYLNDNVSTNLFMVALAFLPAALAGSVLPSRLGGLSDRFGRRPPLIIALLVSGLATLAVPFVQSLWPLALLWVFEAAAFAAAVPAEEALVVDISGGERQGTALGYYTAAGGLGGVIGPLLGGWLYDRFAAVGAFGTSALLMALGAVLILLFVREPPRVKLATSRARNDHENLRNSTAGHW
jgi:MFS transporter, DHA1 family, multidrug resistance protein